MILALTAGEFAAILTALGALCFGAIGAYVSVQNRKDTAAAAEETARVASQSATRADLESIIGAQRQFIADTTARVDDLAERVAACDRDKAELAGRVAALEREVRERGGP